MQRVVVIGGGFAGCAAAVTAAKLGMQVTLIERTDLLLAGGNRAGRMDYNGKIVAAAEAKALGGGEVFQALESILLHRGNIVDEENAYIYNTALAEVTIRRLLESCGIELLMETRVVGVEREGKKIRAVRMGNDEWLTGDTFIDATGGSGGVANCLKYGKGCVMCVYYRCYVYGDRISPATLAGAPELIRRRPDGTPGATGGSVRLYKETLDPDLNAELEARGTLTIPLPSGFIDYSKQGQIGGVRTKRQMESINLVDIGIAAKSVGLLFMPLTKLRQIPGFANVQLHDPLGGGKFHFIGKLSMAPREDTFQVKGFDNLFVAGEKAGPGTGIAEVICTGIVAGYNAAARALGAEKLLILPQTTLIGDFIHYTGVQMSDQEGLNQGYSMGHGIYFTRMKQLGFYDPDPASAQQRIAGLGLSGVLEKLPC